MAPSLADGGGARLEVLHRPVTTVTGGGGISRSHPPPPMPRCGLGLKGTGCSEYIGVVFLVFQKLQIQSKESREDSSAQSTPSSTPHSSPKQKRRSGPAHAPSACTHTFVRTRRQNRHANRFITFCCFGLLFTYLSRLTSGIKNLFFQGRPD